MNLLGKICVKKAFLTKKDAIERISQIQAEKQEGKKPIRSYRCDKCRKYHLTSWSKRKKKIIKEKRIEEMADYWIKKINRSKRLCKT